MYFLWYLLIGLIVGYIASLIVKGSGSGLLLNIVIGIVGGGKIYFLSVFDELFPSIGFFFMSSESLGRDDDPHPHPPFLVLSIIR